MVIHGPEHRHSLGELADPTLELVAEAWQRRARETGGICFALLNEGHDAGASLPHSHSQLAWLPVPPPAAQSEAGLPQLIPVLARDGVAAGCPVASRVPYELLIAPERLEPDGLRSELLAPALQLLAELIRRIQRAQETDFVPLNAWLHPGHPWHIEVFPRITRLASLELGAGLFVDSLAPETAAAALS